MLKLTATASATQYHQWSIWNWGIWHSTIWHWAVWQTYHKQIDILLVSVISGYVGSKARLYMDEQSLPPAVLSFVKKPPNFMKSSQPSGLSQVTAFKLKHHFIGMVAAFIAILTLAEDLSSIHQAVIGILTSMVGSQWLSTRLEGGVENSPYMKWVTETYQASIEAFMNLDDYENDNEDEDDDAQTPAAISKVPPSSNAPTIDGGTSTQM